MENTELHASKLAILSRLIKESSLTLEEALLLLKQEEVEEESPVVTPTPWNNNPFIAPFSTTPYIISSGSGTYRLPINGNGSVVFSSGTGDTITTTTTAILTPNSVTADLNN